MLLPALIMGVQQPEFDKTACNFQLNILVGRICKWQYFLHNL